MHRRWITGIVMVIAAGGVRTHGAEELPAVFREDFEKGADRWQPMDPKQWKVQKGKNGHVFSQFVKNGEYKPPHRSPFNIALRADSPVSDFVLDARVLSTHPDYGHRDACVVFGFQDPSHFYYVHFGKQADDHANQIFIVNGAPRTKISTRSTSGTNWDDQWHHVRVVRKTDSGEISVFFDDMESPVMTAVDRTFLWGRVGVGTFDDTSDWDDVELRGKLAKER